MRPTLPDFVIPTEAGAPATAQRRNLLSAGATVEERRFSSLP
jgi:hypothetical protein